MATKSPAILVGLCLLCTITASDICSPCYAGVRAVVVEGDPAPGSDFHFGWLSTPTINSRGEVGFSTTLESTTGAITRASYVWRDLGLEKIAQAGDDAPGTDLRFGFFNRVALDNTGRATLIASLESSGGSEQAGVWSKAPGGALKIQSRSPELIDGMSVRYNGHDSGHPVNTQGDYGIFGWTEDGIAWARPTVAGAELFYTGMDAPGIAAVVSNRYARPTLGNEGSSALFAEVVGEGINATNNGGIWSDSRGLGWELLAREGDEAPGVGLAQFDRLNAPGVSGRGETVISATLRGDGITSENDSGVWLHAADGSLALLAREGDLGADGETLLGGIGEVLMNEAGDLAFRSYIGQERDGALWSRTSDGVWALVAKDGQMAPGTDAFFGAEGSFAFNLGGYSMNDRGQVAFTASLLGEGISSANDRGLWAQNADGELELIIREGDTIDVSLSGEGTDLRTVDRLIVIATGGSSNNGWPTGFNSQGQLAFTTTFTDGTSAVLVSDTVATPLPLAGDFNGDGFVDLADRLVWSSSFGSRTVPWDRGDANGDGFVNAADYTIWRDAYHASAAQSVPEPGTYCTLLTAWLAFIIEPRVKRNRLGGA